MIFTPSKPTRLSRTLPPMHSTEADADYPRRQRAAQGEGWKRLYAQAILAQDMRMHANRFMTGLVIGWVLHVALSVSAAAPKAAVVDDALPGVNAGMVRNLSDAVRQAGYEVTGVSGDAVSDEKAFVGRGFDLLVLPNARVMPLAAIPTVRRFMRQGGDVIACGLPAWAELVVKVDGKWLTRAEREALVNSARAEHGVVDFAKDNLGAWKHSADRAEGAGRYEVVADGRGKALHVIVPRLTGWNTLLRELPGAFAKGQSLTCFRAKGGPKTKQMLVEWMEQDGSRWIATVDLGTEWKDYRLPPEAFVAWLPPVGRGGRGDRLRVENVRRFSVGLAMSHAEVGGGPHEYWFADLGTARNPLAEAPKSVDVPHIEGLCPEYIAYPVESPKLIGATGPIGQPLSVKAPQRLIALHARPGAAGYNKGRPYRWQPLLYAVSKASDYAGVVGELIIPLGRRDRSGVCAAFTPADPGFFGERTVQQRITDVAKAMRRGAFLAEGGGAYFTVFEGQPVPLGTRVVSTGDKKNGQFSVRISAAAREGPRYDRTWTVRAGAEGVAEVSDTWTPPAWPEGGYRIATELFDGNVLVDRLTHELHVWRPKDTPRFIESRDGGFWLDGKPWKAHGVNYMPSSGMAQPNGNLFEHWVGGAAYDPDVIDRDLMRIKAMNMNSVSVFIHHESLAAMNMLDLLRRCEALDLRVNLSLRPGTPMNFQWAKMREMIEKLKLARNDTVFAYDLAWEPSHYGHEHQRGYASAWSEWVVRRHGSIETAAKAWGVATPMENGRLSVPPIRQLIDDGPWRKRVADYRLFLDEMLREKYAEARRLVKSIDPNHAVSFRMQLSGDPTIRDPNLLPYDFHGLADAVDIWEPEAYGRIGDWERVKPGHFTAAYARLCDPGKPVLWAEMGYSVWDNNTMGARQEKLEFQARYYREFYRMMKQSGADGVYFWWYPGGYRVNEKSDYGIINADGTDRPVTKVIREEAAGFLAAPKPPNPDHWIAVDRDRDARGLYGMYESAQKEYWESIEAGKTPGLRWERRPGSR